MRRSSSARIVNRADEAKAAGQPVRKDDDPEVFKPRLAAYERDTAAVTPFYRARGLLHEVDGMAPIERRLRRASTRFSQGCRRRVSRRAAPTPRLGSNGAARAGVDRARTGRRR